MADWYLKRNEQITGPYSDQELHEWYATGRLITTDLRREGETGYFIPAGEIPGFLRELQAERIQQIHFASLPSSRKRLPLLPIIAILIGLPCLVFFILISFNVIHIEQTRGEARRSRSKYNLKQIGAALLQYHDAHQTFPPGAIIAEDDAPRHSWQSLILPYLDQRGLYQQIDFELPWNAPYNQRVFQQQVPQYQADWIEEKSSPEGYSLSHYVGNEQLLKNNQGFRLREITDGVSNTIAAVERGAPYQPWGNPTNLANPTEIIGPGNKTLFPGGNHVLFCDGRAQFISKDIDPAILKALSTPDGGEPLIDY